jgi:hypothetical protein
MIIQSLVTTFIVIFVLIAAFGHVLLLQAMFAPKFAPKFAPEQRPTQTDQSIDAPVTAGRIAA